MAVTQYFLGGNTVRGFVSFYSGFCRGPEDFLWVIKGGPGCGKSSFMKTIGRAAEEKGLDVDPKWKEVTWEEALDYTAKKLKEVRDEDPRGLAICEGWGNRSAGTGVYTGPLEAGLTDERLSEVFGMPIEVQHTHGRWSAFAV